MNAHAVILLRIVPCVLALLASACARTPEPASAHPSSALGAEWPESWLTFENERVRFVGPPELVDQEVHGIDSLVGSYRSPTLRVDFDLGWYSDDSFGGRYDGRTMRSGTVETTTLEGRPARLARWTDAEAPDGLTHVISLYVPDVDRTGAAPGENRLGFTVAYRDRADAELARLIATSVSIGPRIR